MPSTRNNCAHARRLREKIYARAVLYGLYTVLMRIDHSTIAIPIYTVLLCDMYMYYIERSVNISITRVNNKYFSYVAISDGISTHADFQVDGYHGC